MAAKYSGMTKIAEEIGSLLSGRVFFLHCYSAYEVTKLHEVTRGNDDGSKKESDTQCTNIFSGLLCK